MKINPQWEITPGTYKCPNCDYISNSMGISTHIWRKHGSGKTHKPYLGKSHPSWNLGLTKDTDKKVKEISEKVSITMKDKISRGNLSGFLQWGKEHPDKHIEACSRGGGYRHNSGRSKGGHVIDSFGCKTWLQSSYEVLCFNILFELKIQWNRPKPLMYILGEKKYRYYADFFLTDYNMYLDPKNDYKKQLDENKIQLVSEQNNVKIHVLTLDQITKEYIVDLLRACNSSVQSVTLIM